MRANKETGIRNSIFFRSLTVAGFGKTGCNNMLVSRSCSVTLAQVPEGLKPVKRPLNRSRAG